MDNHTEDAASYSFWTKFNCKRRGYLHHIIGLRAEYTSRYLLRGGAIHKALAYYYGGAFGHVGGSTIECFEYSLRATLAEYEKRDEYDEDLKWGKDVLNAYTRLYSDELSSFTVKHVETDFRRELADGKINGACRRIG